MATKNKTSFGVRLQRLRHQLGLSVHAFAQRAGLSRRHVYDLEYGLHEPSLPTLRKIASAAGVKLEELIN